MEMVNGHPRRLNERHYTPVERAIREVVYQVEALGAHVLLTDAVVLLDQVKNKVADWIELPNKPLEPRKASDPADIREKGWVVAVHNDYREKGEFRTFWLFTKHSRCIKGEGPSDAGALNQIREQIAEVERNVA